MTRAVPVRVVLPASVLARSPSRADGVSAETERLHRAFGCELIQEAGVLLRLPQVALATAQTLLQRFYYRKSLRQFDAFRVAVSCLFLAAKVEEKPKRIRDVLSVFYAMLRRRKWRRTTVAQQLVDLEGATFAQWRMWLIMVERQVLIDLGFSVYNVAQHPHKFVLYYVKVLDGSPQLAQQAWGYINDSLRADLCVRYSAQVIACAAIFLASRFQRVALPERPPWYQLFDVDQAQLYAVSVAIMELYKQPKIEWLEPLTETNPFAVDDHPLEEEQEGEPKAVDTKGEAEMEVSPQEPSSFASAEAEAAASTPAAENTGTSQEVKEASTSSAAVEGSERRSRWDDAKTKTQRARSRSPEALSRCLSRERDHRRRDTSRRERERSRGYRRRSRSRSADRSRSSRSRRRRSRSYSRSRSRSHDRHRRRN
ncbi:hypothetical protein PHYSODRAFT_320213 [Phytophthora sojae]|uniref:Cyclin-like domain-containing protein n=1 Tax=Phytophthora sojae (strain P6497) TaxID=1094619 RepID=G5AHC4_PHYSP|nr:hypothetical protein PHYSODRAFT_320213 [Phytophthora sojae]EGZ05102.1 hypothetical protein PHYSODRAFT_320213 [Phytophthora sojae]|eukprot:XP_009539474.1 hypothetical protein PHYSODRAFT_320213 [Phytophthora sojae]